MDMATLIQIEHYFKESSICLLICPYCHKDIPDLRLKNHLNKMYINLRCSCLLNDKFISLQEFIDKLNNSNPTKLKCETHLEKRENNCPKCSIWLCQKEIIKQFKLSIADSKCLLHESPANYLCKPCKMKICFDCATSLHKEHPIIVKTNENDDFAIKTNQLQMKLNYNKLQTQLFIIKIDEEINRLIEKGKEGNTEQIDKTIIKLYQMKTDIQAVFETTNKDNIYLIQLYSKIQMTVKNLKTIHFYQIMRMLKTITINTNQFIQTGANIEEQFSSLQHFLRNEYILIQENKVNENNVTLKGHGGTIWSLIQLNNGLLVSCSFDKSIKVWDVTTHKCQATLKGHTNAVVSLLLLHDGRIGSASYDCSIKLWNSSSYHCETTLYGHSTPIEDFDQLSDGTLVSGSWDQTIELWDLKTFQCKATLVGHTYKVICLFPLMDGNLLSGSFDHTIKIWDIKTNQCLKTLIGHEKAIGCLIQMIDGRIASGSWDNTIKIWNIKAWPSITSLTLTGHTGYVECIIQLSDGRLASGGNDNCIKLWNTITNECLATLIGHNNYAVSLVQLKDGRLASGSWDKSIKLWFI